jgi:hypothetical protein
MDTKDSRLIFYLESEEIVKEERWKSIEEKKGRMKCSKILMTMPAIHVESTIKN